MGIEVLSLIESVVRIVALAAFGAALLILATHWAVRRRLFQPFGWWPRFLRSWSDPVLRMVERRVARGGGNPQDAPLWLLGGTVVVGLLAIGAVRWLGGAAGVLGAMRDATGREWLRLAISATSAVLMLAIVVRVVAGWLGAGRYHALMRPFYWLSDWLVEPIRRRLPPFGPLDLSPVLAYLLIMVLRGIILGAL